MRYLIAAAAALSVIGGSAAIAQPYEGRGVPQGYSDRGYYDQGYDNRQPGYDPQGYRGQYNGGAYAPSPGYGYVQPYANGNAYRNGGHGVQVYSYNNRSNRHVRREHRQTRERHYVASRGGHDRHR